MTGQGRAAADDGAPSRRPDAPALPVPARRVGVDTWLLPGDLAHTLDGAPDAAPASTRSTARTARDWVVDSLVFTFCFLFWLLEAAGWSESVGVPEWLLRLDVPFGLVACLALWWRREHPILVGLAAAGIGAFSNSAGMAVLVAFFSLALHRGWRWGYGVALLAQVLAIPHLLVYVPDDVGGPGVWTLIVTLTVLLVTTAGLMVRARRQLVRVLAARAEELRARRDVEVDAARAAERERIAREMHDVLAHRLSLLAVHAGALEYRISQAGGDSVPVDQLAESITVVRRSAHLSLEELREVLHLMRVSDAEGTAPPAPTLAAIPQLVDEARAAGQEIVLRLTGTGTTAVSASLERTAYRIVQEGLTNARKHAAGSAVDVAVEVLLTAPDGARVRVRVVNPVLPGVSDAELPGARAGQLGLSERVALHGGTLRHVVREGRYVLEADLPLRAERAERSA